MSKKIISLTDFAADFSAHLNQIIFGLLRQEERERGIDVADTIAVSFLAIFIDRLVRERLNQNFPDGVTNKQKYEIVSNDFNNLKKDIQDAVAFGFQSAMSDFIGKPVEYYCQVKPVPEPISDKVC